MAAETTQFIEEKRKRKKMQQKRTILKNFACTVFEATRTSVFYAIPIKNSALGKKMLKSQKSILFVPGKFNSTESPSTCSKGISWSRLVWSNYSKELDASQHQHNRCACDAKCTNTRMSVLKRQTLSTEYTYKSIMQASSNSPRL